MKSKITQNIIDALVKKVNFAYWNKESSCLVTMDKYETDRHTLEKVLEFVDEKTLGQIEKFLSESVK